MQNVLHVHSAQKMRERMNKIPVIGTSVISNFTRFSVYPDRKFWIRFIQCLKIWSTVICLTNVANQVFNMTCNICHKMKVLLKVSIFYYFFAILNRWQKNENKYSKFQ